MSQNSLTLPTTGTVSGLQMAQDINNALDTLNTNASGASAPASPEAGQFWHDTTNNILKIRSLDGTSWIPWLNLNETTYLSSPVYPAQISGGVNRIINSGMQIDQVKEGGSYALVDTTPQYTVDQWQASYNTSGASTLSVQQVSDAPPGFVNSLKLTVGTGGAVGSSDYCCLYQSIEAANIDDFNLGSATAIPLSVQFWVKASSAGTYAISLMNSAENRVLVQKFTITTGGVWQLIQLQNLPGDITGTWATGTNIGLILFIDVACGSSYQTSTLGSWQAGPAFGSTTQTNSILTTSSSTFQITGVQLNAGTFCLPYEKRSRRQELLDCQRYFEKSYDSGVVPGTASASTGFEYFVAPASTAGVGVRYKTTKRAIPAVTLYSPNSGTSAKAYDSTASADVATTGAAIGQNGFIASGSAFTSGHQTQQHWAANARM